VQRANGASRLTFEADSDAHIVRGLIAILFAIYDRHTAEEILATEPDPIFAELGLKEHLTPQRSNGLASMVARIRADAVAAREARATAH
jgi:cysteine desulfuration protein SufE